MHIHTYEEGLCFDWLFSSYHLPWLFPIIEQTISVILIPVQPCHLKCLQNDGWLFFPSQHTNVEIIYNFRALKKLPEFIKF